MKFNAAKCESMTIPAGRSKITYNYSLHGHTLKRTDKMKYLGVMIQDDLKWNTHVNNITGKANKTLGLLRRNLRIGNSEVKDHAYKALVRPNLEYACSVWDPHTKILKTQVEAVQRRAARFVTNRYHNTSSVTDMLQSLGWEALEDRRCKARLTMLYKINHHLVALDPR